jgi:hypothetical protein
MALPATFTRVRLGALPVDKFRSNGIPRLQGKCEEVADAGWEVFRMRPGPTFSLNREPKREEAPWLSDVFGTWIERDFDPFQRFSDGICEAQ